MSRKGLIICSLVSSLIALMAVAAMGIEIFVNDIASLRKIYTYAGVALAGLVANFVFTMIRVIKDTRKKW